MIILIVDDKRWSQGRIAHGIQKHVPDMLVMDQAEFGQFVKDHPRTLSEHYVCEMPWYESSTHLIGKARRYTTMMGSHALDYYCEIDDDWQTRIVTRTRNRDEAEARLPQFDAVLCVSQLLCNSVSALGGKAILTYPGVDVDLFHPRPRIRAGQITVGWCGQAAGRTKGYGDVWLPVRTRMPEHIVVSENTRSATEALTPDQMVAWYNSLDLLVSTSCSEGFQTTILEAMACGVPVVVTAQNGACEAVNGGCGWIVPTFYDEQTAQVTIAGILEVLRSIDHVELAGKGRGARLVAESWSWKELAGRWAQAIIG